MAASGAAVTVLTPNGRRQAVKVSPNAPLLQVLEDVCRIHGFNPDDHGLKFQRTVIDLTVPWRFANLPNNAKLEMVTSTRKQAVANSQVRIALQTEDGTRHQASFSCGQSLWDVLTHFPMISMSELSESGSTPVCVYMRDEVSGEEALKNATLKSLGLTGGSAIVRFLLKKDKSSAEEDDRETNAKVACPTTFVAKETTQSTLPQPDPNPSHLETPATDVPVKNSCPDSPMETLPVSTPATAESILPVQQEDIPISQDAVRPKASPVERAPPEEDCEEAGPSGLSSKPSSSSATTPSAPFIPFSGGGQRLGGSGACAAGRSLSSSSMSALATAVESPKAKKAKSSYSSGMKCQITANQPDEDMDHGNGFMEPVEREPLIYHLDLMSNQSAGQEDLPDNFFEITVDDVRKRFAQLKSERKLLEEAPLMTKSLREARMKEKMDRYPKVVLRVQFPDRHVLQGFFRPLETVGTVRQFVKSHMENPQLSFYLFTTPPKTILNDPATTLFQADLFPGALVYFGSDEKRDFYLKRELLESSVSALRANESIAGFMIQSPPPSSSSVASEETLPPLEEMQDTSRSTQDKQDPSVCTQAAKTTTSDPGKVPKWFKHPGKK